MSWNGICNFLTVLSLKKYLKTKTRLITKNPMIQANINHKYKQTYLLHFAEAVAQRCSAKKGVLRNFVKFTRKYLCQSLFFNKVAGPCNFMKKETLAQVLSCEFCEISKSTFFTEHLQCQLLSLSSISWLIALY